jgi:hypothetical protein
MTEAFPQEVQRFLIDSIDSVEQLEILLLLRGDPARAWSVEAVGQAVYTSPRAAHQRLEGLRSRNLLAVSGNPAQYRYQPNPPEKDAVIARLADVYRERRVTVISLIYSRGRNRVDAP